MQFVRVGRSNFELVELFLMKAGTSLETFRYFSTRPLSVLNNHLCTWLIEEDGQYKGYGHLDWDGSDAWLGIAIAESSLGKGFGRIMMEHLVKSADELGLKSVRLSVDNSNVVATRLYESFDFRLVARSGKSSLYQREGRSPASVQPR